MRYIPLLSLLVFSAIASANSPPEPQDFVWVDTESVTVGEAVNIDLSTIFSDPDLDDLTYHLTSWSAPLPQGLTLDSDTGIISGTLLSMPDVVAALDYYAEDPSGEVSAAQSISLWVPISNGPNTNIWWRQCDPSTYMCIPGYSYNAPNGAVFEGNPNGNMSTSLFPMPPTQEVTRASALVGYEGEELTPAISAFLRPNDAERLTAEHLGLARHTQIADVTINAELTYSQTGGVRGPADPPQPEELPFGAIWQASLISFQLAPEANGVIDGAFCDWEGLGYFWESGRIFRDLTRCIRRGGHPHIIGYQEVFFDLPVVGEAFDEVVTDAVVDGLATASLSIARGGAVEDPEIFIGVWMYQLARYGGVVDAQNTLHVSFDDPAAMAPEMAGVTEPSFEPSPTLPRFNVSIASGGCLNINGHGKIPLTIYGNEDMAAMDVDVDTIKFGEFELSRRGKGGKKPACSLADVDLDGMDDLACQFIDDGSSLAGAPGEVQVSLMLEGGDLTYYGADHVCLK